MKKQLRRANSFRQQPSAAPNKNFQAGLRAYKYGLLKSLPSHA